MGSCKSTVRIARQLRLSSESQAIGHRNIWQLTNLSLSNLPTHRLKANIFGYVVAYAQSRVAQSRVAQSRVAQSRVAQSRVAQSRVAPE